MKRSVQLLMVLVLGLLFGASVEATGSKGCERVLSEIERALVYDPALTRDAVVYLEQLETYMASIERDPKKLNQLYRDANLRHIPGLVEHFRQIKRVAQEINEYYQQRESDPETVDELLAHLRLDLEHRAAVIKEALLQPLVSRLDEVIVEVRITAPENAPDKDEALSRIVNMYKMYAKNQHLELRDIEVGTNGSRFVALHIRGTGAGRAFVQEAGKHRIEHHDFRKPDGRVFTTPFTVNVLPVLDTAKSEFPKGEFEIEAVRGSGPGGQHRNKNFTGARVKHLPTGEVVTITKGRSFEQNEKTALRILRARLAKAAEDKAAAAQNRSRRSQVDTSFGGGGYIRTYDLAQGVVRDTRTRTNFTASSVFERGEVQPVVSAVEEFVLADWLGEALQEIP